MALFWYVLRCNSSKTLALTNALSDIGLDAWTPIDLIWRRLPRSHIRRKIAVPYLPSFVFIPQDNIDMALGMRSRMLCPQFGIMKVMGKVVLLSGYSLEQLRSINDPEDNDLVAPDTFNWDNLRKGTHVTIQAKGFESIGAVVKGRVGKECLVEIGNKKKMVIAIPPFLLVPNRG